MTHRSLVGCLAVCLLTWVGCERKEEVPQTVAPATPTVPAPPASLPDASPASTHPLGDDSTKLMTEPSTDDVLPSDEAATKLRSVRDAIHAKDFSTADELLESLEVRKVELSPSIRQQVDATRALLDSAKQSAATGMDDLEIPQPPLDPNSTIDEPMK